jgi:hypothetical protein
LKVKPRKCKAKDTETGIRCNIIFDPRAPWQEACSPVCAINLTVEKKAKDAVKKARKQRQERRDGLEAIKSREEWIKSAQTAFNAWIRARDDGLPCVSCGRLDMKKRNAGHFMPTSTRPSLRFEPMNVHLQDEYCNTFLHGNLVNYRIELVKRIGIEKVEWLESDNHPVKKWTIDELKEITKTYRQKLKEFKIGN